MKTSIATVSISGDLREKLAAIAAAGFDGIEIFENDFLAFDGSATEVGRLVREHGLEITVFQPFRDFEGMPKPQRVRAFDRAERKFDVMQELGTDLMLVCSNVSPLSLGGVDLAAEDLHELAERALKRGLRIGYEALAWGRHVSDHRDAWEIVRRADHSNLGLILDSFHTLARQIDLRSIQSIPGDRIFLIQLADAPLLDMDLLYWSRHYRNLPGQGDLPVTDFMRAVAATGYDGPLSLEIFNDQFRGGSPKSISVDGLRSIRNLMDSVARLEPEIAIDVPPMPDRVRVKGVEFVEFAADEREAEKLVAQLKTLGFVRTATHRSKDVELYRQGGINIVVNTEKEGLAYSSYLTHGTSAYAIGLKVDDATATVARARALGATTFEQPRERGELAIPAIRGVGGGVVYFLDDLGDLGRVWDLEFGCIEGDRPIGAGLEGIDHVAQTMSHHEMLTWVLFYVSIFRTNKSPTVDVIDPGGVVRSQAIESDDKAFRLTLNGAENDRTLAGRFFTGSFGSSVQHIAFHTNDVFSTAEAFSSLGFKALVIPGNYYDDLEARFDLAREFSDRLRANNILYDRDEQGEYFQLYSETLGNGFFFEVVERRDAYRGYGAPNAQYRTAAQQRLMERFPART